ncbi:hypothetical protein SCATT_p00080 (plasmid) [Streptantibioticus cattleyicolor NRRL 8057 = DSM 46488]|uniref:Uncharacterized protein n=1 Tax=Streptantibioticus cattleyicolor (strain ATCC 35852 / DSM 46488 / JCM 4925 / NBRC 14057 / NRRL 8057) TaxID=1003195 RepID=G8XDK7_STREN|nr:hypothetical protein SCATT_p00080 [Streptantibioticus cattleyicolor NRRL 8057 = DSM 46488]
MRSTRAPGDVPLTRAPTIRAVPRVSAAGGQPGTRGTPFPATGVVPVSYRGTTPVVRSRRGCSAW